MFRRTRKIRIKTMSTKHIKKYVCEAQNSSVEEIINFLEDHGPATYQFRSLLWYIEIEKDMPKYNPFNSVMEITV
jgi:hypothetical protein